MIEKEGDSAVEGPTVLEGLLKMIHSNAFVDLNYAYPDVSDVEDKESGNSFDLFFSASDAENLFQVQLTLER